MSRQEAQEKAYAIMAACISASWIEKVRAGHDSPTMTAKAVRLRDKIADELLCAYAKGVREGGR